MGWIGVDMVAAANLHSRSRLRVCVQDGQLEVPEDVYQATFDTLPGEWTTIYIPWQAPSPGSFRLKAYRTRQNYSYEAVNLAPRHSGSSRSGATCLRAMQSRVDALLVSAGGDNHFPGEVWSCPAKTVKPAKGQSLRPETPSCVSVCTCPVQA